jgi:hypothetical protein
LSHYRNQYIFDFMVKAVIALAVLVALGAGAYYWYTSMQPAPVEEVAQTPTSTEPAPTPGAATAVAASGQTDEAIATDAATIDGQIQQFGSDNADINSSANDQTVPQSSL